MGEDRTTHFGFQRVAEDEKAAHVERVFSSVAPRYDLMNDVLSGGLHRLWKAFTIRQAGVRPGMRVLDVAAGTGDLARAFARAAGPEGLVVLTDINAQMLTAGRDRLLDEGRIVPAVRCDAERLPFPDRTFDVVSVGFGLRNMTHKEQALAQMRRVLKPGGRLLVLEFSKIWQPLAPLYDAYSMRVMPWLGERIAGDAASYRYLAESIRVHPSQPELARMMEQAGLERVQWFNFAAGICALHVGYVL
ncbi:MAG TPA: bifunctional demethylmenaquinone methyltransferase/2-methoxy-6-polyprenyl-1,4-benzoquinol methylase UbiE [Burkholderiaceae bacterium]|jgi:demethylmenaquinone methyltransferase/2-methoxy-6-polyprenyl-1,4-benzoquinol methylase|nr:bifunctional demethylmenaquinone methyltransferase/2-methoxy-6-polyprenyl-1,4-benzoquinol methylase UbiE [Burkholderiaceae bacterium]